MVTPVDFHALENLRTRWIRGIDVDTVEIERGSKPACDVEVIMRLVF
jgi:hypothetical protein